MTSVDAPSSWNIEDGPPASGVGSKFNPAVLVSLTAPKPLVKHFKGRHFIGGRSARHLRSAPSLVSVVLRTHLVANVLNRFVTPAIAKKYDFEVPEYDGIDQIVEVGASGQKL